MPPPHGGGGGLSHNAPLSSSSLEAFSAAELALSGAGGLLLLIGAVFVAGVASASRSAPVLTPFTALWAPRLALHATSAAALGAMLLRLPAWWSAGAASWAAAGTALQGQRLACRLSVALAYGAALPTLGALAAGLSAAPLRAPLLPLARGERRKGRPGTRVLLLAAAAAAPAAAAQALIAFHDDIFGPGGGLRRTFGPRWLDVFVTARGAPLCATADTDCALCVPPLLASAVSALAALAFGFAQLWASRRLSRAALSGRLARRARAVGTLLLLAPLGSAGARGVACLFRPRTLWFELLMVADFAAVLLAAAAATLPLAVLPSVAAAQAGAAIGWGDPAAAAARDAAARGGSLLEPLMPAAEVEGGEASFVPSTPATTAGSDATSSEAPTTEAGPTRSAAMLSSVGANSTRRALLSTPATVDSATPSSPPGSGSLRGGTGGSASGGSRYGTPYS